MAEQQRTITLKVTPVTLRDALQCVCANAPATSASANQERSHDSGLSGRNVHCSCVHSVLHGHALARLSSGHGEALGRTPSYTAPPRHAQAARPPATSGESVRLRALASPVAYMPACPAARSSRRARRTWPYGSIGWSVHSTSRAARRSCPAIPIELDRAQPPSVPEL